jgi:starch synthase
VRILLASSEVHPYSKTGGLADMVGALAKALARAGNEVSVVTPLYRGISAGFPAPSQIDCQFEIPLADWRVTGSLRRHDPESNLTLYFVDQPRFFDRSGIYQENGSDYGDNGERFIFFSKCVAHLARRLPAPPDVVHVHDWQTALVPALIRHAAQSDGWANPPRTCLTIHNLSYQGVFPATAFAMTNLPPSYFTMEVAEFYRQFNCLKTGIALADVLTTVSPRYAREITTEEFGCGLDGLIRKRRNALSGILNGVDAEEWKTSGNPFLRHDYSAEAMLGKAANKLDLQRELGLPVGAEVPLFGTVSRLADQKGMDLLLSALEQFPEEKFQFALLGSGDKRLEAAFIHLAQRMPERIAVRIGYDQGLSHRIEAGCDFFLMPSRFEPCGLNQMYSLRYGTVPIVRATGGLDDTVVDAGEDLDRASGIKFLEATPGALALAIRKALALYQSPGLLSAYRQNGMANDFSWNATVKAYERIYRAEPESPVNQPAGG